MFRSKSSRSTDVEIPTTTLFVPGILARTTCEKHEAGYNQVCHRFESIVSDRIIGGICNARAIRAGVNDPIRPQSLDRSITNPFYRRTA